MREFEQAVRRVYASTMDPSALQYRRQRGLEGKDEQMAVLVQRVSGSYQGDYFFRRQQVWAIAIVHTGGGKIWIRRLGF